MLQLGTAGRNSPETESLEEYTSISQAKILLFMLLDQEKDFPQYFQELQVN